MPAIKTIKTAVYLSDGGNSIWLAEETDEVVRRLRAAKGLIEFEDRNYGGGLRGPIWVNPSQVTRVEPDTAT